MRNPTQLAAAACRLGMVPAPPAAFLELAGAEITGTPAAAVAAPAPCAAATPAPKQPGVPVGRRTGGDR